MTIHFHSSVFLPERYYTLQDLQQTSTTTSNSRSSSLAGNVSQSSNSKGDGYASDFVESIPPTGPESSPRKRIQTSRLKEEDSKSTKFPQRRLSKRASAAAWLHSKMLEAENLGLRWKSVNPIRIPAPRASIGLGIFQDYRKKMNKDIGSSDPPANASNGDLKKSHSSAGSSIYDEDDSLSSLDDHTIPPSRFIVEEYLSAIPMPLFDRWIWPSSTVWREAYPGATQDLAGDEIAHMVTEGWLVEDVVGLKYACTDRYILFKVGKYEHRKEEEVVRRMSMALDSCTKEIVEQLAAMERKGR